MLFQIDWASLVVGTKFTVFALFYFVFEGNFQVQAPPGGGAYIWRGDLTDRLATSGPLGERSEPYLAAKRPNASDQVARGLRPAPYEIRRRTFLKVYLTEGFLRYEFGRLIFGGAYFRDFTVSLGFLCTSA